MTCDHSSSGEFGDVLEKETKSKRGVPGLSATGKAIPSRAPSSCYSPWRRVPQASWDESSMMHFTFQMSLPSGTNLTAASHVIFLHPMLAPTAEKAVGYEMQVPVEDMNLLNRCLAHRRSLCSARPSAEPGATGSRGTRCTSGREHKRAVVGAPMPPNAGFQALRHCRHSGADDHRGTSGHQTPAQDLNLYACASSL